MALAATEDSVSRGAVLLGVYSAGLGVPFLAAALGVERFLGFLQRFRRHLGTVERATGVLLVVTGVLFSPAQSRPWGTGCSKPFRRWGSWVSSPAELTLQ